MDGTVKPHNLWTTLRGSAHTGGESTLDVFGPNLTTNRAKLRALDLRPMLGE